MEKIPTFLQVRCICKNRKIAIGLKLHIGRDDNKTLQLNLIDSVKSVITSVTLRKSTVVFKSKY